MRRIEPAYPDLFPVTHVVRPGYLPGPTSRPSTRFAWASSGRTHLGGFSPPRDRFPGTRCGRSPSPESPEIARTCLIGSSSAEARLLLVLDDPESGPTDLGLERRRTTSR